MFLRCPSRDRPRLFPRARLTVHRLEDRLAPATFNIANGDIAGFIAAINTCNTNNQADTINLAAGGTYTFTSGHNSTANALPTILPEPSPIPNPNNTITINGNGAILERPIIAASFFRFFQVNLFSGVFPPVPGTLILNNVTLRGAQTAAGTNGGAIFINGGIAQLENSTLTDNRAGGAGGGISCESGGSSTIVSQLSLLNCTVSNNQADSLGGGGIYFFGGTMTVVGSTLNGNTALTGPGGGLNARAGNLTVINSTIEGNRSTSGGGAAIGDDAAGLRAIATIRHATITNNSTFAGASRGGGVSVDSNSTLALSNTIIAGNRFEATVASGTGPDIAGVITSQGFNLVGTGSGATGPTNGVNGDQVGTATTPINPLLGPLLSNGGPTRTRALLAGSPAIDAGNPNVSGAPPTDQRGTGFPRILNNRIDIGAFEGQQAAASPPRVTGTQINGGAAQRSMVTNVTVTFSAAVTFATTPGAAFTLTRSVGAAVTFTAAASTVGGVTTVTLNTFRGAETTSGSLNDGRYTLTALAAQISANGVQLDGNGDGTAGDNFTLTDAQRLFRLYGDSNGDGQVDNADFFQFRTTFGLGSGSPGFLAYFDFNADGLVDNLDFFQFRTRFGTSI